MLLSHESSENRLNRDELCHSNCHVIIGCSSLPLNVNVQRSMTPRIGTRLPYKIQVSMQDPKFTLNDL